MAGGTSESVCPPERLLLASVFLVPFLLFSGGLMRLCSPAERRRRNKRLLSFQRGSHVKSLFQTRQQPTKRNEKNCGVTSRSSKCVSLSFQGLLIAIYVVGRSYKVQPPQNPPLAKLS